MTKQNIDIHVKAPYGLNSREKRRFDTLCKRMAFLYKKTQATPKDRLQYCKGELSALEWTLNVVSEHYEHINICENLLENESSV